MPNLPPKHWGYKARPAKASDPKRTPPPPPPKPSKGGPTTNAK